MHLINFSIIFFCIHLTKSISTLGIHYSTVSDPYSSEGRTTPIADYEDVNSKSRKSEILNRIIDGSNYDFKIRPPGPNGTGPALVTVGLYLRSVENVDDVRMQYSVQMTLWQEWVDTRLKYSHIQNNIQYLHLVIASRIWMPDIFFRNEKSGYLHELLVPNMYTRLFPDGRVLQSYRISLVLSCPMNLRSYPLDVQECPISMASYGWTTRDLVLKWRDDTPVQLAKEFNTPRFNLKKYKSSTCDKESKTSTGSYSCVVLKITFAREFGFYLIQIYLPCTMLVIVSWVSFWLEPTAIEARVSLGVTTILTIVTQTYGINQSAPPASYAKALDIWTAGCQVMVFGALLEFAAVNYLWHVQWIKAKKLLAQKKIDKEEIQNEEEKLLSQAVMRAKRVDRSSRIIFPIIFAIFNVFYWFKYLAYP